MPFIFCFLMSPLWSDSAFALSAHCCPLSLFPSGDLPCPQVMSVCSWWWCWLPLPAQAAVWFSAVWWCFCSSPLQLISTCSDTPYCQATVLFLIIPSGCTISTTDNYSLIQSLHTMFADHWSPSSFTPCTSAGSSWHSTVSRSPLLSPISICLLAVCLSSIHLPIINLLAH